MEAIMNKVELHGTVDRLEVKKINDKVLTSFTVIVKTIRENREFSNYIPVDVWKSLEISNGDFVRVEGSFSTKSWDNQSGGKNYKSFVNGFMVFKMTKADIHNNDDSTVITESSDLDKLDPVFAKKSLQKGNLTNANKYTESFSEFSENPEDIF
jgi:single-stranded DNA-binding protein